ncbi:TraR/DksA C4-type zinc finger protein [Bacillus shivajii]|uniref:TraR/DksA C4-type zinc finger protein n=1 Tax=Bacillus shivajii TaxID=1983719 RepID=UPI001CFB1BC2|nr:TraR/DksA C4-type zinc finger protein [Bacillus shivajii]UCZ55164.1 TraR/DksA C4-type zinc finger protein [Bacillus shivajii]
MLNQEQLNEMKEELIQERDALKQRINDDHFDLERAHSQETVGELSNYDNHPGDGGTELYEREKDISLEEHAEQYLKQINDALTAMEKGEYGLCEVCGSDIPYERLEVIPATKRCIEHAEHRVSHDRPVEEEVLKPPSGKFKYDDSKDEETFYDSEDAIQEVSQYGSSDTPSDLADTEKDYNQMFDESNENIGYVEEVENILTSDIYGHYSGVSVDHNKYEDYLEESQLSSNIDTEDT